MKIRKTPRFVATLSHVSMEEFKQFKIALATRDLTMQDWFQEKIREEVALYKKGHV